MVVLSARLYDSYSRDHHYVVVVECDVESGTYVRSLAEEFGRRLGLPATISALRRLSVGPFNVSAAEKID